MTVANPREVPEYELNPLELQVRKSDGISKVCFSFFHLVTFDLVIQQLWLFLAYQIAWIPPGHAILFCSWKLRHVDTCNWHNYSHSEGALLLSNWSTEILCCNIFLQ